MDIPQISCSRRATFENDNTWVPGRTWRATFVFRKTALDNATSFSPLAVETVHRSFYVDDCLRS